MKRRHIVIYAGAACALVAALLGAWAAGRITFFAPWWLLGLAILPLLALLAARSTSGLSGRANLVSLLVRTVLFLLLVACLADIQGVRRNESLSVFFVLDHSASVPESILAQELKYANAAASTKSRKDTAGIVVAGDTASVEMIPAKDLKVDRLFSYVGRNYTDLQGGLELAVAAFPSDARRKIVLVTDGNENKGNLLEAVKFAAGNAVITDILPVSYDYPKEVMIEKLFLPEPIKKNETFDLKVHIQSLQDGPGELTILRNGVTVGRQSVQLKKGRSVYAAPMKIEEAGFYTFTARISSAQDTIPENNEASGYVYIQGESKTLLVTSSALEVEHLARACREDSMETDTVTPEDFPDSLGALQNYDCIVLANVPSDALGETKMAMIHACVRDLGMGLIMIGGENGFGAGGYHQTPIEEALPVTMEIKEKKINPKGALVLILHTCEFPNGNYWAKQITKRAIDALGPQDDVGVLLYGRGEEWLFPLQPAKDKKALFTKIDGAEPGDMPSFAPTVQKAHDALSVSDAMVRHVIIISDGDPSPPSPQLIKNCAEAGITISTVGINPHSARDVDVLKYIASETGGRYYFADDPSVLPRIFVKEAKVVKRSLIFNKPFQPQLVAASELTKGIEPRDLPALMAYVATTPKPRALVPIVSDNDNHDPILAHWRYGLGKSVAFTSDASANWGKDWVRWNKYKRFWTQTVRWAARKRQKTDLRIHTEMDGSRGKLIIDAIAPDGAYLNFMKMTGRVVSPDNQGAELDIRQTAPGRYEAGFEAGQVGVSIINVGYQDPKTGGQGFAALGVSVPYSPEFLKLESNLGLLRQAAAAGGGRILTGDPAKDKVFTSSLPPHRSFQPLWEGLAIAALILFLIDVTLRRVIVTRADVAAARAAIAARFRWGRKPVAQDATLAALLDRKQKTFEQVKKPVEVSREFKASLDQTSEQQAGARIEVAEAAPVASAPADTTPAKPGAPPAATAPSTPPAADGDSYTGRLLAAKKRAKK